MTLFWIASALVLIISAAVCESVYTVRQAAEEEREYAERARARLREMGLME